MLKIVNDERMRVCVGVSVYGREGRTGEGRSLRAPLSKKMAEKKDSSRFLPHCLSVIRENDWEASRKYNETSILRRPRKGGRENRPACDENRRNEHCGGGRG